MNIILYLCSLTYKIDFCRFIKPSITWVLSLVKKDVLLQYMNTSTVNTILFIDDDKVTNFYNRKIVNKYKKVKNVISVDSGKSALEYLLNAETNASSIPDLIFLDINMPGMSGWEFIEEYKKIDPKITKNIKVILLTTSSNNEDYERSKQIEIIDGYINKPLSVNLLEEIVKEHY